MHDEIKPGRGRIGKSENRKGPSAVHEKARLANEAGLNPLTGDITQPRCCSINKLPA